ncbi:hypothetical protein [Massilia sp. DJPM01]|uniref:hypothetical protein n=1 Tax=Massilia sp. DJPM01 TaxID=3024404 RepID=UPI0035A3063A
MRRHETPPCTRFPDDGKTRLTIESDQQFALKLRYPGWVRRGAMQVKVNGTAVTVDGGPGAYVSWWRAWLRRQPIWR